MKRTLYVNFINDDTFPTRVTKAIVRKNICDGCAFCVDVCPPKCLEITPNRKRPGFKLVHVDAKLCNGCGACQGTCPKEAIYIPGLSTTELREMVRKVLQAEA